MLRGIHKASTNWLGRAVMGVVMGLLVISFGIWGIGGSSSLLPPRSTLHPRSSIYVPLLPLGHVEIRRTKQELDASNFEAIYTRRRATVSSCPEQARRARPVFQEAS